MAVYPSIEADHRGQPSRHLFIPRHDLLFIGPHVEKRLLSHTPGGVYEDVCFNILAWDTPPPAIRIIGPHLIDHMLGSSYETSWMIRPDAIFLQQSRGEATIVGLGEFKSGKDIGFNRKLNGFKTMLSWFSTHSTTLPWLLYRSIGKHVETPRKILIPDLSNIEVRFIAPFENGVIYENRTRFRVTWQSVPSKPLEM